MEKEYEPFKLEVEVGMQGKLRILARAYGDTPEETVQRTKELFIRAEDEFAYLRTTNTEKKGVE